ncbi:MAG TPA: LiaF domain-containing protein, partial [Kribbella sp.]|nr:LiaF domain-containing protein [Kribbella sp.]
RWRVKQRTNAFAMFGGHDLDMTDAVFEGREVTIYAVAVFGGIDITVPEGVTVRNEGIGIFGGFAAQGSDDPDPNAPTVVIKGLALFGGVGGQSSAKRHRKRFKNNNNRHGLH